HNDRAGPVVLGLAYPSDTRLSLSVLQIENGWALLNPRGGHAWAQAVHLSRAGAPLDARCRGADDRAVRGDLPSGTVTFLFTDVEGSTRLLRELGAEAYAEALAEHRRVVRRACAAAGGVEVDTQGDAF